MVLDLVWVIANLSWILELEWYYGEGSMSEGERVREKGDGEDGRMR